MIAANFTYEAIRMLKEGTHAEAVCSHLVALGADPSEARAHVDELVRLKQQAETPVDVEGVRQQIWQMMQQRVHIDHIVAHVARYGVADSHARAEVHRLAAMKTCEMCGVPMERGSSFFDRVGREVCRRCHNGNEIAAAQQRVVEANLEAAGVPLYALQKDNQVVWCPRCQDQTGVLDQATHMVGMRGGYAGATRQFRCARCGLIIT